MKKKQSCGSSTPIFQFANCNPQITNSMTKLQHACMALSPEIQRHMKDLFQTPPEDPYAALKKHLCEVFARSAADIAARVLDAPQLGDSSAIGLVASMLQHLPRSEHESHVVRESFLRRLPLNIRRIVEIGFIANSARKPETALDNVNGRIIPSPLLVKYRKTTKPGGKHRATPRPSNPKYFCFSGARQRY